MSKTIDLTLMVWRQESSEHKGSFVKYPAKGISTDMSFLEMLDFVNEQIIEGDKIPFVFESDCREGICGACSLVINGVAHGPDKGITTCQLHMRKFKNGETIWVEPWRAKAFPVIKDLVVDRSAFDRIQQKGGYVSVNTGAAQDGNALLIPKGEAESAFDAAACIGCGACVAACKNASAMLFVGAKVSQFKHLPQGHPERKERVQNMVAQMDKEGFGACTTTLECSAVCPKEIGTRVIADLNQEFIRANLCDS